MANHADFTNGLLTFLQNSPTPFHCVQNMAQDLEKAGFERLDEKDAWQLVKGQRYYTTRNGSSIIAFVYGTQDLFDNGIRMMGAHTDSPCLRVKPNPTIVKNGYCQLGVEVYGGVLLNPWFDRDLSLAGRITYRAIDGKLKNALVNFDKAIATIPSVAIHLDREQNTKRNINKQKHLPPVLFQVDKKEDADFNQVLAAQLKKQNITDVDSILDYELSFYDVQPPAIIGLNDEFLASARLDNLLSCYMGLQAIINSDNQQSSLLVCNDHEEVGSCSSSGAQGPMLKTLLQRWVGKGDRTVENYSRVVEASMMISADNAHGVHPNYSEFHDNHHGPILNKGPVIKINANQSYASNSETQGLFRHLCDIQKVPVQSFVTRTDMGCGSTIGPITATQVGVKTLDIGVPTFGMHSIRELAGSKDAKQVADLLQAFVNYDQPLSM